MFRRFLILQILVLGGLSTVFLLPPTPDIQPSAVIVDSLERPDLPSLMIMSGWTGGPKVKPTEKELSSLADDTNFARRNYTRRLLSANGDAEAAQSLQASIVLSGKDINNSLHRPERCLPSQGLNIESSTVMSVPLRGGKTFNLTKLHCSATDKGSPERKGSGQSYVHLNYYWFVGRDSLKHTHYGRTLKDMRDRLIEGYDQRWAYVTLSLNLLSGQYQDETGKIVNQKAPTEEEADRLVTEFAAELMPEIIRLNDIKDWD
ncbi:MAG: exosortase-associated EpsI family protein [Verrucomicrobiota bacterium]